jgi:Rrf2 family cysteine metabolism transcriptional repressor
MKLSTRGRYGVRAMFELACNYGQGPIPLKNIAEKQNISESYLEQLLGILRKGGLVRSIRGAQGGYQLAKPPEQVRVGDVIRVLEGPIAPAECVSEYSNECINADKCVTRVIWEEVKESIENVLDNITLHDMYEKAKNKGIIEETIRCL